MDLGAASARYQYPRLRNLHYRITKTAITGAPDMDDVNTSIAERQNLSMRMGGCAAPLA